MPTYIVTDDIGAIAAQADWHFPGSIRVDYEIVRGWDGKLYKAGEEPAAPVPTTEELFTALRAQRDSLLIATNWLAERHRDEQDAGQSTTLGSVQYSELLAYRQALRDVPEQPGAPENVEWPAVPDFVAAATVEASKGKNELEVDSRVVGKEE